MMFFQRKKMNRKKKIVTGVGAKIWYFFQFEKNIHEFPFQYISPAYWLKCSGNGGLSK